MKIIDTHVHFWNPEKLEYHWIKGNPVLERSYLPSDLEKTARKSKDYFPEKLVFVEAGCASPTLDEVTWVESVAEENPVIAGIVAHADLEQGDAIRPTLEQLAEKRLVKGIRRLIQSEPLGFSLQPDFVRGVQAVADYGFTFDLCIFHPQMGDVIELVRQCPDVTFILDHIGKPGIKAGEFNPWRAQMKTLAGFENVWCKISGVVTEADHEQWTTEQVKPYILHAFDAFGSDRVMFGSDWPVLNLAGCYPLWHDTLETILAELDEDEKEKFYFRNAEAFYRLG